MLNKMGEYEVHVAFIEVSEDISSELSRIFSKIVNSIKPVECQLFDASKVISEHHAMIALINAYLAFKSKTNIAKNLKMEALVRLSAQDQISVAIEKFGIKDGNKIVGAYLIAKGKEDIRSAKQKLLDLLKGKEVRLEMNYEKLNHIMESYSISKEELKTVQADSENQALFLLVAEKIASTDLYR